MSERTAQLLQEVLALPPDDRAEFTRLLWEKEMAELPEYPCDRTEEEEQAELDRRLASIEDGTADPVPFDEAMDRIAEELARRQKARDAAKP